MKKMKHFALLSNIRRIKFKITIISELNPKRIKHWLGILGVNDVKIPKSKEPIVTFIHQGLALACVVARESGLPLYSQNQLMQVIQDPQNSQSYEIYAGMEWVDNIPESIYTFVVEHAFQALFMIIAEAENDKTTGKIFELLNECINRLRQQLRIGQSTIVLLEAAASKGIPYLHLGEGIYQFGWGSSGRKIDRSTTDKDSAIGSKLTHNKSTTANLLRMSGFPTPEHRVVSNFKQAYNSADEFGWPVVVKPSDLDRGEGVSVGINDNQALDQAFHEAYKQSKNKQILIEKEIPGVCHRLLVVGGKLLYAIKRLPKSVLGDGIHTIAELIEEANDRENQSPPWKRVSSYPNDLMTQEMIFSLGYTLDSIPSKGVWVPLRKIESGRWGGRSEDVTHLIHPDNADLAIRAAELFSLEVAGVDMITKDISLPWYETMAMINEINYSPLLSRNEIYRKYWAQWFDELLHGNGKIPVEAFVGYEEAMNAAMERFTVLKDQGLKCYLSSESLSLSPLGEPIHLSYTAINPRAKALALRKDTEALIIVLQTDEVLVNGFSLGTFDRITILSETVRSFHDRTKRVSTRRFQEIK